jgi:RNA polymerase sigma-54 factor
MTAPALQFDIRPQHTMHASPELVTYAQLLHMSAPELEARIELELVQNPALVRAELLSCPTCGAERAEERCVECQSVGAPPTTPSAVWETDWSAGGPPSTTPDRDPAEHPTSAVRLIEDARLLLSIEDRPLVAWLVGNLDDDGFLRIHIDDLAMTLDTPRDRLEMALAALRVAGPPAIGAYDLRECLLLQLARLDDDPRASLAASIVRDHLESLGRGYITRIASILGVARTEVLDAREFIRTSLEPRPMPGLHRSPDDSSPRIRPDVIISRSEEGSGHLAVELVARPRAAVEVDSLYVAAAKDTPGEATADRRRLTDQVHRASAFVAHLRDRERTLQRIARLVVDRQAAFVRFGPQFVQPLTRTTIAAELGLHESTVSRAIAQKFVQLPSGRVIPFGDFFDTTLAVQDVLRGVLESEDRPMTDADLMAGLRARGYRLARRTVAKYRQRLGFPAAGVRQAGGHQDGAGDKSRATNSVREGAFV